MPWPLQGDPPGAKKNLTSSPGGPQGPTRREDTPPRKPPGTLKVRKPPFPRKGNGPPKLSLKKTSFFKFIKIPKEYVCFGIKHSPLDRQIRFPGPSLDPLISCTRTPGPPRGLLWAKHAPPGPPRGLLWAKHVSPGHPKMPPQGSQAPLGTSEMSKVDHQNTMEI